MLPINQEVCRVFWPIDGVFQFKKKDHCLGSFKGYKQSLIIRKGYANSLPKEEWITRKRHVKHNININKNIKIQTQKEKKHH